MKRIIISAFLIAFASSLMAQTNNSNNLIHDVDGRIFNEVPIKYNAYSKELVMKRPSGDSLIVFPDQVHSFVINDPATQTSKYNIREIYFPALYTGKTSL